MSDKPSVPPQQQIGLIERISENAVSDDFVLAAEARAQAGAEGGSGEKEASSPHNAPGWTAGVALFLLALMLVTAAVQRSRSAEDSAKARSALAEQVEDASQRLQGQRDIAEALRSSNESLRDNILSNDGAAQSLLRKLETQSAGAGLVAVRGPGLELTIDDAVEAATVENQVYDKDLQRVVNGLFTVGAEAIAINGHRLTSQSAIRAAGEAITVNYRSLSRPYVVRAIGDSQVMLKEFPRTTGGSEMMYLSEEKGLQLDVRIQDSMWLPGGPAPSLRYAKVAQQTNSANEGGQS